MIESERPGGGRRRQEGARQVGGEFVHVGFGTIVATDRILAIVSPDSEPLRRLIATARQEGKLLDATHGRRTKALLVFDNGQLMTAALHPETLAQGSGGGMGGEKDTEEPAPAHWWRSRAASGRGKAGRKDTEERTGL
jgi:regulator of extracellular matrix RemA (YlzA/DUF370 family)